MKPDILHVGRKPLSNGCRLDWRMVAIGLMFLLSGVVLAGLRGIVPARAAASLQATPSPGSGTAASQPVLQATFSLTAILPTLPPTLTSTATLLPLPAVTFQAAGATPTQALLVLEHPGSPLPPKDSASPAVIFLRRWGGLLAIGGLWAGLALWLGVLLALWVRGKNPGE